MRRLTPPSVALLTILLAATFAVCKSSKRSAAIEIDGPTVIAFFPTVSKTDRKHSDEDEALSDFQLYTASARQSLQQAGVGLEVVYSRSFEVVLDSESTTFKPAKGAPGYYFAMPGKKPRIDYGVMTDADLLRIAKEYFGIAMK
jgi:hypothetical protein